jgi:hypothetical protein
MKTKPVVAVVVLVVACVLAAAPAAGAQTSGQDSVVGTAWDCTLADACRPDPSEALFVELTANARSGLAGEGPAGTMTWDERVIGDVVINETQVTCLAVTGRVAIIGVEGTKTSSRFGVTLPIAGLVRVTDGGSSSGQDSFEFDIRQPPLPPPFPPLPGPTDCSAFPTAVPTLRNDGGDLVVTDAPRLPTSKEQCKNGAWQAFGAFKNQGDCVSSLRPGAGAQTAD